MDLLICPYCNSAIHAGELSRDHIFPDFLGGTRRIPSCATCNNKVFGARFESKAARQLLAFQLMLSSLGVSTIRTKEGTRWAGAYEHDGELYDLELRDGKTVLALSSPKVIRDETGKVVGVSVRSKQEAKQFLRKNKHRVVEMKEIRQRVPFDERNLAFEFGPDFGRIVLKMAAALSTLLPAFDPEDIAPTVVVLSGDAQTVNEARMDFRACPALDQLVPLLSHGIYVERGPWGLRGLVKLFGVFRMWCHLSRKTATNRPSAVVAVLNVRTGVETFTEMEPLDLGEAPLIMSTKDRDDGLRTWMVELDQKIRESGVSGWQSSGWMPARPRAHLWQSSTVSVAQPSWTRSTSDLLPHLTPQQKGE